MTWRTAGAELAEQNGAVGDALIERLAPQPGQVAIPTSGRATELATGAGFDEVDVEEVAARIHHGSVEEWWACAQDIAGPFAAVLAGLSGEEAATAKASIREWAAAWETDGAHDLPGVALVTLAC